MFLDVYFHKTRRILDLHLTEFLRAWLDDGVLPSSIDRFLELDDIRLLAAMADDATELSRRMLGREFFRQAFFTDDHPDPKDLVAS